MKPIYSYKNLEPQILPERIFLSDGFTRTDSSTYTADEIRDAGFTGPYEYPEFDSKTQKVEWTGSEYIVRPYNNQELNAQWEVIRNQRNQSLKNSDWSQISDYDLVIENQETWKSYRQELRDLPQSQQNPFDIIWPNLPL